MSDEQKTETKVTKYKWRKRIITSVLSFLWVVLLLGSITNAMKDTLLARDVLENHGTIPALLENKEHKIYTGRKGRETHRYILTMKYLVSGNDYATEIFVDANKYDNFSIGEKYDIIYFSSDPHEAGFEYSYKEKSELSSHYLELFGGPFIFLIFAIFLRRIIFWIICRG